GVTSPCLLILTGLVCLKTVGFLFVKTRRLVRRYHEDFCEAREGEIRSFRRAIQECQWSYAEIHTGAFQEDTCCSALTCASERALLLFPQPFFGSPHGNLRTRGKA